MDLVNISLFRIVDWGSYLKAKLKPLCVFNDDNNKNILLKLSNMLLLDSILNTTHDSIMASSTIFTMIQVIKSVTA